MIYLMYKSAKFGLVLTVTYLYIYIYIYVAADTFSCNYRLNIKANIFMLSSVLKRIEIIAPNVKNQIGH